MDTIDNTSHFYDTNKLPTQYPWLSYDEECEVLVVGGGVTGCMVSDILSQKGIDTVLISDRPIGYCPTSIDGSTLNYQNELMLTSLSASIGKEKGLSLFKQSAEALDYVEQLSKKVDNFDFARRDSFLYTDSVEKLNDLHTEYLMRKHNGIEVEFLEKSEARELFSFEVQAGILSKNSGGELDIYKFCHALAKSARDNNARVFENTAAVEFIEEENRVLVVTDNKKKIKANKVVFAIGYRQINHINSVSGKKRAFFLATAPVESFSGYESRALVKNINTNINLRTTEDNRIIISGLDCTAIDKEGKIGKIISIDRLITRKYAELANNLKTMLCGVSPLKVEYRYNAIYGATKDSLPIVGEDATYKNTYFNMPSSVNATLYSVIAAKIIAELYLGNEAENIFSPNRNSLR